MNKNSEIIKHEEILKFINDTAPLKMRNKFFLTHEVNEAMRDSEKNISIKDKIFLRILIKSLLPASLLIFLIFVMLVNTELFGKHIEKFFTASVGIFLGFFAFNYTLFNNQWKYTADLYNKIYIEMSFNTDPVALFRKRCLLAHDILLQDLQYHSSFEKEFNQTVILAAYFCNEFNLIEKMKLDDVTSNQYIKFSSSPEKVLTEAIIACENAELSNFLIEYNYKKSQSLNVPLQLINTLLDNINNKGLSIDESKKMLLETKMLLQNADSKEAYQLAIDHLNKAA